MIEQGTEEWRQQRCGLATASAFADILAKGKGDTRAAYMRRLVAERLIGRPLETFKNAHMDRGHEQEPLARAAYEIETGHVVEASGFVRHPRLMAGCSPDGLVDMDGGTEIKSVIPTVQIATILAGYYPLEHKPQIQGNLWITGRQWWDFISYCPDLPEHLQLYVYRVTPDHDYIGNLALEVARFLKEADELYLSLTERKAA